MCRICTSKYTLAPISLYGMFVQRLAADTIRVYVDIDSLPISGNFTVTITSAGDTIFTGSYSPTDKFDENITSALIATGEQIVVTITQGTPVEASGTASLTTPSL